MSKEIALVGEIAWKNRTELSDKEKAPAMVLDGLLYYYDSDYNQIKIVDPRTERFYLGMNANPNSAVLSCEDARIKFNKAVEKERIKFRNKRK